jgi:hypothetical protein
MLWVKRVLGTLVVPSVGGYLAFDAGILASPKASREMATSLCNKMTAGLPVRAALALAPENVTEGMLHAEVDEMVVSFRGGCSLLDQIQGRERISTWRYLH